MLKNDEVFISDVRLSFSLSFAVSYTITKERETYGTLDDLNRVLPVTSSYGVNTRSSFTRHNFFFFFSFKISPRYNKSGLGSLFSLVYFPTHQRFIF